MFMQTNSVPAPLIPLSLYSLSSSSPQLPHFWENLPLLSKSRSSYWRPGPAKTHQGFPHTCSFLSHHHHHHNHHHHHYHHHHHQQCWFNIQLDHEGPLAGVPIVRSPNPLASVWCHSWQLRNLTRVPSILVPAQDEEGKNILENQKCFFHLFQSAFFGNFLFFGRLQLSVDSRMDENWFLSQLRITERERAVEY